MSLQQSTLPVTSIGGYGEVVDICRLNCIHVLPFFYLQFLGRKVYLSLQVRVDEDWRSSDAALLKYGYVERE